MTRWRKIAAELVEHMELSKNKLHDLTKLVDSLIVVIQELARKHCLELFKQKQRLMKRNIQNL